MERYKRSRIVQRDDALVQTPLVLDSRFRAIFAVSKYQSLIWTERYMEAGDFELVVPVDYDSIRYFAVGNWVYLRDTDYLMIIETIEISSSAENGTIMKVSGRSAESILDRRVMWGFYDYPEETPAYEILNDMIDTQFVNPTNTDRKLNILRVEPPPFHEPDPVRNTMALSTYGDNVYTLACEIAQAKQIGFRVCYDGDTGLYFQVYSGIDRSLEQTVRPTVIFSQEYGNLTDSNQIISHTDVRTAILVFSRVGDLTGNVLSVEVSTGAAGLDRRELFYEEMSVDGEEAVEEPVERASIMHVRRQSLRTTNDNLEDIPVEDQPLTTEEKIGILTSSGQLELAQHQMTEAFECTLDPNPQFEYGLDYFLGDKVQVLTTYGVEKRVMVTEVVRSWDENGKQVVPTFVVLDE